MRAALIATVLAIPAASLAANDEPRESPLVDYAQELHESDSQVRSELKAASNASTNLRAVSFEMSHHPPPRDEDCARTLGARRFADQYGRLGAIQDQLGNFEASIEAYRSALACEPRDASYEAAVASAYLSLARIAEARSAAERAAALDSDNADVRNVRARVDFIQEHWADATARFRLEALERGRYAEYADYSRCFLWLAQRRAGVRDPELPPKESKKNPSGDNEDEYVQERSKDWPVPILEALQGHLSEADLVQVIRDDGSTEARQWLTEALFYVGELRLAEGDVRSARRHFASVINLRVLNFVEYGMARAELAKLRELEPVADSATPGAGARPR